VSFFPKYLCPGSVFRFPSGFYLNLILKTVPMLFPAGSLACIKRTVEAMVCGPGLVGRSVRRAAGLFLDAMCGYAMSATGRLGWRHVRFRVVCCVPGLIWIADLVVYSLMEVS